MLVSCAIYELVGIDASTRDISFVISDDHKIKSEVKGNVRAFINRAP